VVVALGVAQNAFRDTGERLRLCTARLIIEALRAPAFRSRRLQRGFHNLSRENPKSWPFCRSFIHNTIERGLAADRSCELDERPQLGSRCSDQPRVEVLGGLTRVRQVVKCRTSRSAAAGVVGVHHPV
jgi:hypothetical protein